MKNNLMKKLVATGLVLTMVMGGGTAAFAHGKDKDNRGNNKILKGNTKITININFNDMKNAQWAMRYIASLASKRVFEGYEDGSVQTRENSYSY